MANAYLDENGVPTITGALNTDGVTVTRINIDPSTHRLGINDGTTGSDNGVKNAIRDENGNPVLLAVSSADGVTTVQLYADSLFKLLIKST